jgi:hypothetical protein
MKNRQKFLTVLVVWLLVTTACGPVVPPAPTLSFGTPDLTLTAIFSVLVTPATPTPPVLDTDTPAPPVNTPTETVYVTPNAETLAPTLTSVAQTAAARASDTPLPSATFTDTPIPSATSTFTPVPTVTPTQPSRSGPTINAPFLSPPPDINGSLGEWGGNWIDASNVVFGKDNRSGASDLSAKVKVGWDWNYLYLAVQVTDDTYAQHASGADLFLGDSLEILLDTNLAGDYTSEGLSSDDYQLGISGRTLTNDDKGEAYLWYPEGKAGSKSKVIIQARPTDAGYRMEVAIPWSVFGVDPASGMRYGFAFGVSDNDNPNANEQHSMVSNVSERKLTDPTTWGNLFLNP